MKICLKLAGIDSVEENEISTSTHGNHLEEAYKAYAPQMEIVYSIDDLIKNHKGRIVLVEGGDSSELLSEVEKMNDNCETISREVFETGYKENTYTIEIIEINENEK